MRKIKYIVIHCTASWQTATLKDILNEFHLPEPKGRGWKTVGYHHLIFPDGKVEDLLSIETPSNGVAGYNANSIHISYIGGIKKEGTKIVAVDNRTDQQRQQIINLILKYKAMFPDAVVLGHRDFSRDQNGNGIIDAWEFIKQCPCYDVRTEMKNLKIEAVVRPTGITYKLHKPLIFDSKVAVIQEALKKAGIKTPQGRAITVDKYFGSETDLAVKAFQKKVGLEETGIVDQATQDKLGIKL